MLCDPFRQKPICDQGRKLAPACQGAAPAAAIVPGIGTFALGPVYGRPIPCARQCCSKIATRSSRAFMWLLVDQRANYQRGLLKRPYLLIWGGATYASLFATSGSALLLSVGAG